MSVRRISMFRDSMIPILQVFLLAYLCNGQAKEFQEYGKYGYVKKGQDSKLPSENFVNASTLIAGGTPAEAKEFPHMALIGYGKEFKSVWWGCGGSLISEKFIMSAAHCTVNTDLGPPQWVLLGALNELATKDDPQRKVYSIVKVHNHPEYNSNSLYHDISLFQLNTTVEFSPYVRLACLHTSTADFPAKTTASITGWGLTGASENPSDRLLKATIMVFDQQKCRDAFPANIAELARGYDSNTMICAGHTESGRASCPGDSGGPLQIQIPNESCKWNIIGVTSFGPKICGNNKPAVYTKVSYYLNWIQSIVWP